MCLLIEGATVARPAARDRQAPKQLRQRRRAALGGSSE
jgi:hypothetical protein